jgi:hypothetical protein
VIEHEDTLPQTEIGNAADVTSIDAIVKALYESISSPGLHAFLRMRTLFRPDARLMPMQKHPDGSIGIVVHNVDEFVALAQKSLQSQGFHEREVARHVEHFGHIAHVFSTYESRRSPTDVAPFARGINSIQLVEQDGRWWIIGILWQDERLGVPIPKEFLPRG